MKMLRKVPLIVILGSTGTGKTKLSLELAERFGGEIISADSMQVYANLNIVTAKATKEEQSRAKHHLLDVATPTEPYTVVNFRNAALPIIERLLALSKCPIIVGGTNYYIESLLWDVLVGGAKTTKTDDQPDWKSARTLPMASAIGYSNNSCFIAPRYSKNSSNLSNAEMSAMSSELLYNHLRKIDPETANRMHPNNKRKIMRAIEVYQETGQTLSSKLKEQRSQPGGNRLGGPLRYPHTILLWLRCKQDELNARLDKRVDAMLEQGLLSEVRAFYNAHISEISAVASADGDAVATFGRPAHTAQNPYTKGILQTIGFKEFIPYLEQFNAANDQKIEEYLRLNEYRMPTEENFKFSKCKNHNYKNCTNESLVNDPKTNTASIATNLNRDIQFTNPTTVEAAAERVVVSSTTDISNTIAKTRVEPPCTVHDFTSPCPNDVCTTEQSNKTTPIATAIPAGLEVLNSCLSDLKLVTRRYSRKQIKWINNRFLASKDRQVPDMYELDSSDASCWHEAVYRRAETIINSYRSGQVCEVAPLLKRAHPGVGLNEETSQFCTICQRHFIGEFQWRIHLQSNKHKRRRESERKKERLPPNKN